ncbi:unnamed protein product [Spirodela intermedia]|uniref:BIG2 domain-containing protein n=1 Tax=Spirodela intermedia TaxID=51605 RepID=A0A7I8JF33_SPIIN|nr:unnamed protein product [Spirodela intermedia]CAA6668012.1 unnamed protein product [Spirodela intermedia]
MAAVPVCLLLLLLRIAHGVAGSLLTYSGLQIADLNVLLPPRMTNPVHYRLLGTGGCFSWTWDHHDILHVEPEYNGTSRCSTSARLVSIAPYSGRKETAVYAADINSGTVIRCEVFIDNISRIQIFHHSVKLDLDGLATLQIRAFDSEDNVFSSLVGLQFVWKLMPKSVETDHFFHHLVHVPLKETPLTDCGGFCGDLDTQIKVEDSGMGSDLYVVKGIEIGHEIVSAQLFEPQFENVTDKIILTVAEAMSLHPPSPVFVITGSLVQYTLRIVRQNNPKAVDLPSLFHRWSVSNSTVSQVDSTMGFARALNLGVTNIFVEDTRVTGHFQMSTMHVIVPDKLCLYIRPITGVINGLEATKCLPVPWFVVIGQEYAIHMKVFTHEPEAKEIYITESNRLTLESDSSEFWDLSIASNDVAAGYGWRNSESSNHSLWDKDFYLVLKVEQRVIVCDKVRIQLENKMNHSKKIRLPWAPGVYQGLELKAFGGCGMSPRDYGWCSTNVASVSVSSSGYIQAKYLGRSTIKVTSVFDPLNFDEIVVEVSTPASMVLIHEFPVEALVGTHLLAAVFLKTTDGDLYFIFLGFLKCFLCRELLSPMQLFNSFVKWRVLSESEVFLVSNTTGEELAFNVLLHGASEEVSRSPCSWTYLYASNPGHAVLHASFSSKTQPSDLFLDGEIALQSSAQIAAYHPLAAFQAGNGNQFGGYFLEFPRRETVDKYFDLENLSELYLAPGSAMDVFIIGGPDRWGHSVEYIDTVKIRGKSSPPEGVILKKAVTDDGTLYNILCQKVGNFNLIFSRGNLVGDDHPFPAISDVEMVLACSAPSSITLIGNEQYNTLDVISSSTQADRGPGKVRISPVIVANGRTIRLAAVGIHISGRPFANSSSLSLRWELNGCEGLANWVEVNTLEEFGMNWERFLILENSSGLCTVRATVIGFSKKIVSSLEDAYLLPEISENSLTDAVYLQLVSLLRIVPESALLYFHPDAKANLSIIGGTCFIDAVVNDTHVADIVQPPQNAHFITVYDIGLSPPVRTSASVTVADVDWIKIMAEDEISLMEGTRSPFEILVGTTDGSIFDSSMYFYMNIYAHVEDSVIELEYEDGSPAAINKKLYGSKFLIKAQTIGLTSLSVSVRRRSGREIYSQIIKVEVYAQLRIHPDNIFLTPGASYVFSVEGGPTLVSGFDYASLDNETATIDGSSGKLTAVSAGNTTIRASIYTNGGTLVCEAFSKVEVGIPSMVTLNLQSEYLCVGCQMPVFPAFPKGDLFSFYEVCKITALNLGFPQYSRMGSHLKGERFYSLDNKDYGFINFLHGRSEGIAKVSVSFSCHFITSGGPMATYFDASQSLTVVPELPLALGLPITWVLPPFYTSSDLLPGSSESRRQSDFHNKKTSIMYSLLSSSGKDGLVQQDAIRVTLGCIQAKDQSGRREIASCVRVAEVAQVRATAGSSSSHVAYLSSNDKLEVIIGYCDNLGYPFFEAYGVATLDIKTNYPNVVSIHVPRGENRSHGGEAVHLQAKSRGMALVKISINHDPLKAVYVLVLVGSQLYPMNPLLYVGCVLKFSTTEVNGLKDLVTGHWLSANESVISIDRHSGKAHALAEGAAQVIYEGPNLKLQTTATVKNMDVVTVNPPAEILTNVPFPKNGHKFSLHFRNDPICLQSDSNMPDLDVSYDCNVNPPFVGYVTPWRDNATGTLYCIFFPYSPNYLVNSLPKIKDNSRELMTSTRNGMLFVSVTVSPKGAPDLLGSGQVLFIGGFSVSEDKLTFTRDFNKTLVTVMGNTDVEIHWDAKQQLSVKPVQKDHFGIAGRAEYEVEVLRGGRFSDKITIKLPATGQTVHISVSYEDDGERTAPGERTNLLWAAVLVCLVLLALTVLVFVRFLETPWSSRPAPSPPPSRPPVPAVAGPSTPGTRSSSPRTPQPFVEYVRRTIDETPYYRREGRRRFDPNRTY